MTGRLVTYQNTDIDLACYASMSIVDRTVTSVFFKGCPREEGDRWTKHYKAYSAGSIISQNTIDLILSYNGENNVISTFSNIEIA